MSSANFGALDDADKSIFEGKRNWAERLDLNVGSGEERLEMRNIGFRTIEDDMQAIAKDRNAPACQMGLEDG
jgi:hypothetical protein